MAKKSVLDFAQMKQKGEQITYLTAYDFPTASAAEQAGLDMLLVGDSLGMVVLGYQGPLPVTMDMMVTHCQAVRRGAPNTFIVGDMPFMSYQLGPQQALENAGKVIKRGRAESIKLEGGAEVAESVHRIVMAGIPVMGHIGLTPQSIHAMGGHKVQAKSVEARDKLVADARALEDAGVFSMVLEGIPLEAAR